MKYLSLGEVLALLNAHRYESNTMFTEWLADNQRTIDGLVYKNWWDGVPPNPQHAEEFLKLLYVVSSGLRRSCVDKAVRAFSRVRESRLPACRITHHDIFVAANILYEEPYTCDSEMLQDLYDFCTKHGEPHTLTYNTQEERDALVVDYLKMCNPDEPVDPEVIADYNKAFPIQ